MTSWYKVMRGCWYYISTKSMHLYLLTWQYCRLKNLKYRSNNAQHRRYGKISSRIFETYKNVVRPNGFHIKKTAADIATTTMCHCTSKHNGLQRCNFVLLCCDKWPSIFLLSQEVIQDTTNTCQTIRLNFTMMFHIVLGLGDIHNKNKQQVHYIPQCRALPGMPKYTHENNLCY